jgi:CubicO group peptidase (beta-lactamase class C family)
VLLLKVGLFTDPHQKISRLRPQGLTPVTESAKFECGGGCAASTAGDYMRFAQMLLNKGKYGDTRILARKTVEYTAGTIASLSTSWSIARSWIDRNKGSHGEHRSGRRRAVAPHFAWVLHGKPSGRTRSRRWRPR